MYFKINFDALDHVKKDAVEFDLTFMVWGAFYKYRPIFFGVIWPELGVNYNLFINIVLVLNTKKKHYLIKF